MLSARCTTRCVVFSAALFACISAQGAQGQWTHFENHSDIRALHEDGDTLWVGTNGGLLLVNVLTGEVVSTITAADGLADNSVRKIDERAGSIYVGTDEGLNVFRRAKGGGFSSRLAGSYRDIRHASFGTSGALYVGTYGCGVARVDAQRVTWITTADSLLDDKVFAVHETAGRAVYYATSMGLCAWIESAWVSFQAGAGFPCGEVRDLVPADAEHPVSDASAPDLFVLVAGSGVYRFDGRRARAVSPKVFFRENDIAEIAVSGDGTLWAAGRYGGIASCRDEVWTAVGEGDEETDDARWRSVHVGKSGIVYFGSADGVIVAVDDRGIRKVSVPSGLPSGSVGPMVEDNDGRVYVANGAYLVSKKRDTTGFAVEKNFGSVLAVAVSPSGVVWVIGRWALSRASGVFVFDGSGWERFESEQFDTTGVLCIFVDPHGDPLVLTPGSVWEYRETTQCRLVETPNAEDIGEYRTIGFDGRGRVYLATSKGLTFVGESGSKWFGPRDGLRGRDATSILVDGEDVLWVGFRRDGISRIMLESLWR